MDNWTKTWKLIQILCIHFSNLLQGLRNEIRIHKSLPNSGIKMFKKPDGVHKWRDLFLKITLNKNSNKVKYRLGNPKVFPIKKKMWQPHFFLSSLKNSNDP